MRGDVDTFVEPSGKGAITYKLVGRVALQVGAILAPPEDRAAVYRAFATFCKAERLIPAAVALSTDERPVAHACGMRTLNIGNEAVLLLACHDTRIGGVVAISPSSVVWANVGPGLDGQTYPYRSSWTWRGQPLPFVPYDDSEPTDVSRGPVAYRPVYNRSLRAFPERARLAAIPIEQAHARVLLVAGEEDQMWPSAAFAHQIAQRGESAGKSIEVISHLLAGHRPFFPGEPAPAPSTRYLYGGTLEADAALGAVAWPRAGCAGNSPVIQRQLQTMTNLQ